MTNIGEPVKTWITEKETTFTDVQGKTITTPPGTLWGAVETTDQEIIQKVDKGLLSAFSVSVAEKKDADFVMQEYSKKGISTKSINYEALQEITEKLSVKRTLIKDIADPVLFTITLTGLPCVNKAMFCENSLPESARKSKGEIIMTNEENIQSNQQEETIEKPQEVEETVEEIVVDEDTFINNVKKSTEAFKKYLESRGNKSMNQKEVNELLNSKLEEANKSNTEVFTKLVEDNNKQMIESLKSIVGELKEEIINEVEQQEKEDEKEQETEKEEIKTGKGGKAHKHQEEQKQKVTPSNQIPNNYDGLGAGKSYHEKEISEREYLMKFIKGNPTAQKSLEGAKISFKGLSIRPEAIPTAPAFSLISPALKDDFSATYTVEDTQKLILNTQQFGLYMRELLSVDPLMDDAQFRIDYQVNDEERRMYALRYDEDPTQDGIMEEHYYFDNPDLVDAQIQVSDQLLDPKPVRTRLHISDRQIRQNVFGESLLDNAMKLVQDAYNEGIARINYFSDTTLAQSTDIKFRRREGLIKQAGTTLVSDDVQQAGGDFDLDDGVYKLIKDMYRSLPLEAQRGDIYNLYVPPYVYEAYREYYLNNDKINFIGNITGEIPLKFNKITVKEAPILADPAGISLAGDKVSMLLTSPQNTHFIADRALRIEPERLASTSSTKYWYTGDFDCKFALPEYAVVAQISKEEYEAL